MSLYAALFDMYNVTGIDESLHGVLTLNYDDYIEVAAAEIYDLRRIDLDFGASTNEAQRSWFLKLHGSFAWEDAWPIRRRAAGSSSRPLWIPPGIRKGKERYPFNLLWGLARDVLNCDVLRIIGCRLGPSDWDLISLLFGTRHAHQGPGPDLLDRDHRLPQKCGSAAGVLSVPRRQVAVRDRYARRRPESGRRVPEHCPVQLRRLVRRRDGRDCGTLSSDKGNENWFRRWLEQMGEGLQATLGAESTDTDKGAFRRWLEI